MEGVSVVRGGGGEHRVEVVIDRVVEITPAPQDVISCFAPWLSVRAIGSVPAAIVKTVLPADPRILKA